MVTPLDCIVDSERAGVLLSPLRLRILAEARSPISATGIAAALALPRQRVGYHVRELARARFLKKAGQRKKRNLLEQRYVATARAWVLSPRLLGPLGVEPAAIQDKLSAAFLVAQAVLQQRELETVLGHADARGKRVATLSATAEIRFRSAAERERFAVALRDAVARLIAEHASPAERRDEKAPAGRPYRLLVSCYPIPKEDS